MSVFFSDDRIKPQQKAKNVIRPLLIFDPKEWMLRDKKPQVYSMIKMGN